MTDGLLVSKGKFTSEKSGKTYYNAKFLIGEELITFEISPQQFSELSTGLRFQGEVAVKSMFGRLVFILGSYDYAEEI